MMTHPSKDLPPCDLVLKGGITSGVVYPRAISRLAESYQIRGVGGTSAGAIAAAFAAAGEYRRRRTGTFQGFEEVESLVADLAGKVDGQTRLEGLLQPQPGTRIPFGVLKFLLSASQAKKIAAFALLPLGILWSVVWGGVLLLSATFEAPPGLVQQAEFAAGFVLGLVLLGALLKNFLGYHLREFCSQNYGLCRGFDPRRRCTLRPQLTDWIHRGLQKTAGLPEAEPLTFAHLEAMPDFLSAQGSPVAGKSLDPKNSVRLRLVTTCLTHSRPYTLPFQEDKFYFDPAEFFELFPQSVVHWMMENGRSQSIEMTPRKGKTFRIYPLPDHGHLPVVVAVRMSLSMPIILSAVNLYCRDLVDPDSLPEKVLFTDGGIVSNFPIHFFDEFVPRYPTFGLNLIFARRELSGFHPLLELQTQVFGKSLCEMSPVFSDMARCLLEHWDRRPGLAGFLEGIYDTARGWKDTTQLRLPGYRERIQDIYLDPRREGGVHLSMTPAQIEALANKGEEAMNELLSKFASCDGKPSASWKNHVWTRYRITMFLLSQKLQLLREVMVEQEFQELLNSAAYETVGFHFGADNRESKDWKGDWCDAAQPPCPVSHRRGLDQAVQATVELVDFLKTWDSSVFQRSKLPTPLPTMRLAKEV